MADTTWTIKFEDDGDSGPMGSGTNDGGRAPAEQPSTFLPPAPRGSEPTKPQIVELTKDNAEIVAAALSGRITDPTQIEKLLRSGATEPTSSAAPEPQQPVAADSFDFRPAREASVFKPDGTFDFSAVDKPVAPTKFASTETFDFARPVAQPAFAGTAQPVPNVFDQFTPLMNFVPGGRQFANVAKSFGVDKMLEGPLTGLDKILRGATAGAGGAAGAAGAEAAAGMGLAGAGGHLAAGYALYKAAEALISMPFEKLRAGIEAGAKAGEGLANNNLAPSIHDATEAVAGFAENTGLAGIVFAEELRTASSFVGAFTRTVDAFVARGRELSRFDANLATATATADVRKTLADIREANRTGREVGRLIDAQSRLEVAIQDALGPLKAKFADKLADSLERLVFVVEILERFMIVGESMDAGIERIYQLLRELAKYSPILDRLAQNAENAAADKERRRLEEGMVGFADMWKAAGNLGLISVRDDREEDAEGRLRRPLLAN